MHDRRSGIEDPRYEVRYADDVDRTAKTESSLQCLASTQTRCNRAYGLPINMKKTKVFVCTRKTVNKNPAITVGGELLECWSAST